MFLRNWRFSIAHGATTPGPSTMQSSESWRGAHHENDEIALGTAVTMRFSDMRMSNGSRHFMSLPETRSPDALRDHIARMPGAVVTSFVFDGVVEAWIKF